MAGKETLHPLFSIPSYTLLNADVKFTDVPVWSVALKRLSPDVSSSSTRQAHLPHTNILVSMCVSALEMTIFLAAQRGDLSVVAQFVEANRALVNSRDFQDVTALHWAAINGYIPIAQYLIDHGAEVDARGGELAGTPLHWATV